MPDNFVDLILIIYSLSSHFDDENNNNSTINSNSTTNNNKNIAAIILNNNSFFTYIFNITTFTLQHSPEVCVHKHLRVCEELARWVIYLSC